MANNLALDRCDLYGQDPAHEEDCWQVFNFRVMEIRTHEYPVVAHHIPYRQAMALVADIPLADIERQIAEWEHETPEEEQAWWDALSKKGDE